MRRIALRSSVYTCYPKQPDLEPGQVWANNRARIRRARRGGRWREIVLMFGNTHTHTHTTHTHTHILSPPEAPSRPLA